MKKVKRNQKGFTLVELLVVIAIIGILAVVAVPALFKNIEKSRVAKVESDYSAIKSASLSYFSEKNKLPGDLKADLKDYMDTVPEKSAIDGTYTLAKDAASGKLNLVLTGANVSDTQATKFTEDLGNKVTVAAGEKVTVTMEIMSTK